MGYNKLLFFLNKKEKLKHEDKDVGMNPKTKLKPEIIPSPEIKPLKLMLIKIPISIIINIISELYMTNIKMHQH